MIDMARLARPYAQAAFDYAQEHRQLTQWSLFLETLSKNIQHPFLVALLKNPAYDSQIRYEAIFAILGETIFDKPKQNFVRLLADHNRLSLMGDICLQFEQLRAKSEKILYIHIKSAVPLKNTQLQKISHILHQKTGFHIEIRCTIDPSLLGGFILYKGDRVIDCSIRGQLQKLGDIVAG